MTPENISQIYQPLKKTEILVGHLRGCCFLSLPTKVLRPPSEAPSEWSDQRQVQPQEWSSIVGG